MAGKMHMLLENLDRFVEVLALAQSVHVKEWDILSIQRGFEWCDYFQHVHNSFNDNDLLRNALENRLHSKNEQISTCIKNCQYVTFKDLSQSKEIFFISLLQNKSLPSEVFHYIVTQFRNESDDAVCILDNIMCQKAASQLLFSPALFAKSLTYSLDNPIVVTQAELLRNSLENRIKFLEEDKQFSIISEILSSIPQPSLYNILAVLLLSDEMCVSKNQNSLTYHLLKWLLQNECTFSYLNSKLLSRLGSKYVSFGKAYLNFLGEFGASMEQNVLGKWVSSNPDLSFSILVDHFICILKTNGDFRSAAEVKLKALKSQEGNYNVPGIGIWTDLLLEMNMT